MIRFKISKRIIFLLIFPFLLLSNPSLFSQILVEDYITDIQFSPNYANDNTLFMSIWKSGLFKSSDQGNTWHKVLNLSNNDKWMNVIALSPSYYIDSTLFAGFKNLFRSIDGGSTWDKLTFYAGNISDIALSPNFLTDHTIYYIPYSVTKFSRNINGGDGLWDILPTKGSYGDAWCIELSPNFSIDSILFIGTMNIGIHFSRDQGLTTLEETTLKDIMGVRDIKISPHFSIDSTLFAATHYGLYMSKDQGDSWKMLTSIPSYDLVLSPDFPNDQTLFVVTLDGIIKSEDRGMTWQRAMQGLTTPYISCLAISPNYSSDHTLYAGSKQGVVLYKSIDGGLTWLSVNNNLSGFTMPNITNSPFVYDWDPSIVAGADGTLHIAWLGSFTDTSKVRQEVFYLRRNNGNWSEPQIITAPTGAISKEFSLAIDQNNRPHIIFRRGDDNIFKKYEDDIYYTYYSSQGLWIEPIMLIDGDDNGYTQKDWNNGFRQIALSVDDIGIAHVAYQTFQGKGFIWYTSNQSGTFVTPPIQILSQSMNAVSADIAADKEGKVHIAVETLDNGLVYFSNKEANFSNPVVISADGGSDPIILIDNQNFVHIAFYQSGVGIKRIGYTNNQKGTFTDPVYINYYHYPTMALDNKGNAHIGFQYGMVNTGWDYPNNEIGYANNSEGIFKDWVITNLTSTIASAQRRYIAITPDDSVHIVYANGTFLGYDLYHLCFNPDNITAIQDFKVTELPISFKLHQNYPNPFNPSTTINYSIPQNSFVTLKVFDILGREVATLVNEEKQLGNYQIKFDGSKLSSGIYFYRIQAGGFIDTKKFILVR